MSNEERFDPAQYCVMAVGGSGLGGANMHLLGMEATYLLGIGYALLILKKYLEDIYRHREIDFRYLKLMAALVAYFGIVMDEHFNSLNGLLTILLVSCVLLPIVELRKRLRVSHKVRGD